MISDITFYALLRFVLPQELFFVLFCNFKVSSVIIFNIKYTLSYFGYRVFVEMYFKCIFKLEYISISILESCSSNPGVGGGGKGLPAVARPNELLFTVN